MADESKPSWKRKKAETPTPAAPRRPEASHREWTKKRDKPADDVKIPRSRVLRVAVVGAAFAASLIGLVILILMIQPPKPAAVVFVGADYATNLAVPQNVAGTKGIEAIRSLSKIPRTFTLFNSPSLRPILDAPRVLDRRAQWGELIKELEGKTIREQTIVFVLALHGLTDAHGAYLLPNRATEPKDGLPLIEVIESMNSEKLKGKNKVLILEGAQIPSDWRLGMLKNEFPRRLKELEPQIQKVDKLWVLSGCNVDQRCWTSEGLGTSVFFHYLAEAFKGNGVGADGRLYLDELHAYAAKNVKAWVWNARAAIQEPILLPRPQGAAETEGGDKPASSSTRSGANRVYLTSSILGAPSQPPPANTPNRDSLMRAWTNFQRLDSQTPHPSVYSPTRWRLYRSGLVRCEELIQAGDSEGPEYLFGRLKSFEAEFARERSLKLVKSAENSLAMNAVQGGRIRDPNPPAALTRFWQATRPDQLKKLWEEIVASGRSGASDDTLAGLSPRGRTDLFLIGRAVSPGEIVANLDKAAERILIAKGEDFPQPSEAHFLRMVGKKAYLPLESRSAEAQSLVTEAISLRQQGERIALGVVGNEGDADHFYCDELHPWIFPLVEKADVDRREAEDLLFASEDQAVNDSREAITRAKGAYQAVAIRAAGVRGALAARDRAFSELIDYCRWLPHRHAKDVSDGFAERVARLWQVIHQLSARLDGPSAIVEIADMAQMARNEVSVGLDAVAKKFIDQQREYAGDRKPEDWEAAMAAAAVPFPDRSELALRRTIWDRLDNIRHKDVELSAKLEALQESELDPKRELEELRTRVLVEGQTALAVLGQSWYGDRERFGEGASAEFARDAELLDKAKTDKDWRQTLAEVGERIGLRFRAIETRIAELLSKPDPLQSLKGARDRLPEAARLAKKLDVHTPLPNPEDPTPNPTVSLRDLRGHDLLNWLARRAWLDHWYDEDPKARPYYQAVGTRFVQDALELFPKSPESLEIRKRLDAQAGLAFDEPKPILLTSETRRNVAYRLVEVGKVPEGTPVVKAELEPGLAIEGENSGGYRMVSRRTEGGGANESIAFTLASPLVREAESDPKFVIPRVDRRNFGVRGFFRGQVFERLTPVEIDPLPEVTLAGPGLPEPPLASLAVRADQEIVSRYGEGNGAIAVVLDCSGSMVDFGSTKFAEAKRSLISVLKQLPAKTRLSIWIFGQAADGFIDKDHPRPIDTEQNDSPERTIRLLREASPWDPSDLEPLRKKLDSLIPLHGTPLLQAMWGAKLDLDQAKGLKTLLVLTDGEDTRFSKNAVFNPTGATIPAFIRENFKGAGIMVDMIFFKLDQKEEKTAREQFEAAITQLDPAGHFFTAQDAERLLTTLQRSIKQRLICRILGPGDKPIGDLDVTSPSEQDRWWAQGLEPGSYTLKVQADQTYSKEIDLEKGDRLIVRLVSKEGGIGFERALYSDDFPLRKDSGNAGGWRFSAARTRYEEKDSLGSLRLFTILEPATGDAPRLRQIAPRFSWFEMAPQAGEGTFAVRWKEQSAYPAAVWRGEIPRWIGDSTGSGPASPSLKAWWLAGQESDESVNHFTVEFDRIQNVKDQVVRADDGNSATIESIRVEPHAIRTRSDEEPSEVNCLVVRIRYPRDKPFFVDPSRLGKIVARGYEHRFYTRAGAYTGLFGPIAQTEVEGLRAIHIISVARLKEQAEKGKRTAELKLAQPKADEKIPEPPQAILKP